jgi:hypothetical protein
MENLVNGTGNSEHNSAETVPVLFGRVRPKTWRKRVEPDTKLYCAINEYIANPKGSDGHPIALANLIAIYAGGPVAVE